MTGGCAYAGIHRSSAYRERQRSEKFALAWSDIEDEVTDRLEATLAAVRLMEFLPKARKPEMYREQHLLEHVGPGGGPVEVEALGINLDKLNDRDPASLQRIVTCAAQS